MSAKPQVPSQQEGSKGSPFALYFFAGTLLLGILGFLLYMMFGT